MRDLTSEEHIKLCLNPSSCSYDAIWGWACDLA